MRTLLIFVGLALILGTTRWKVTEQETLAREGDRVLLEMGPRDPRSLIQGDYMTLRYGILRELNRTGDDWPAAGQLVVALDERGVAGQARLYEGGDLGPDEHLLRYKRSQSGFKIASEEYFFQEGEADRYAQTRFAELRVSPGGDSILIGLLDADLEPLGPSLFER